MDGCETKESSLWYGKKGSKYCKACYDAKGKKKPGGDILEASHPKRPRLDDSASPILTVDAFGADYYISEVFGIKDERCSTQRLRRFWVFRG